jgi:hypothetical protein
VKALIEAHLQMKELRVMESNDKKIIRFYDKKGKQ